MVEVNRNGFTKLSSSTEEPRCNIVFIHGLRGHPRTTWEGHMLTEGGTDPVSKGLFNRFRKSRTASDKVQSGDGGVFWPQELLAKEMPDTAIWTYGYNADVIGIFEANNQNNVSQHGRGLAAALERDIDNEKPLVFIVHSLGGIVLKDALRRSESCQERTKLIIFLGVPHRGSPAAEMGQIAANLAFLALQDSNKGILRNLQVDGEVLGNIHEEFVKIALQRKIGVHSFQESRGMTGIKGLSGKIVDDFSSRLDLPTIETVEPIDADHRQIAKCSRKEDETYRKISGELRKRIKNGVLGPNLSAPSPSTVDHNQQTLTASLTPKRYVLLPSPPNKRFTGRQEKLDTLERHLFVDKKSQSLAIFGLGGVGKTQLALAFSYAIREKYSDYSIFWVSTVSVEQFKQDYIKIAKKCSIGAEGKEEQLIELVREYLCNEDCGKWLLVVDNSDDMTLLQESGITKNLPQSENGITIFTTRYKHIAVDMADNNILHLEEMNFAEAKKYLQNTLNRVEDEAIVEELLGELTCLPLAINQAASYMVKTSITIAEYLELMKDTEEEMVKLLSRDFQDSTAGSTRNAVAVTWLISFELIKRDEPVAADLLFFLATIENKAVPHSILPVDSKSGMIHSIGVLTGYSFLTKQDGGIYDMHRLVHLAVKIWMQREEVTDRWREKTISYLAGILPDGKWEDRNTWRAYMPHAVRVLQDTDLMGSEKRAFLCQNLGVCLYWDGRYPEAIKWIKESVQWRDQSLPEESPNRLSSQHNLAIAYRLNGQIKEAVEILEKVVAIKARVLAEDHSGRLASQHNLAIAYRSNGRIKEAVEILEKVVAIKARVLAEDHSGRLASQYELATAYRSNGQIKEAAEILEAVVAIRTRAFAEDHPDRLTSLNELAMTYRSNGRIKKAVKILENIVAIYTRVFVEDHPDRLASQHNLSLVYEDMDQLSKAISLMQHVVTIQSKSFRADHPYRILSEQELSGMLRKRDTEDLARERT